MMHGKWITNNLFKDLEPLYVFHKELEAYKNNHPDNLLNKHILFRKKVNIKSGFSKAILKISADDYYKLYLNENFLGQGPSPGYHFHYYFNEIDVTEKLKAGENLFAVHTYYQGLINRVWVSGDCRHGFIFELSIDGEVVLCSDESWKTAIHTGFSSNKKIGYDTAFAEIYDSGSPEVNFELFDYDDRYWEYALEKRHIDYKLFKQPTKMLSVYPQKPKIIKKTEYGYFIDLGFEAVGYISFRAKGNKGDKIIIHAGEELSEDNRVRYKMRCNCEYEEEMILSGNDDKLIQYDYKAFRYVDLIIPEQSDINISEIEIIIRHYPYEEKASFSTENKQLEKIFRLCADTIKYGVQECYLDCPTREKGQYLGDVSIVAPAHVLLTGEADMMKKSLENYAQSSFICKGLMTVAPSSFMQEIADYSLQFPMQVLWYYKYTKDIDFLRQMHTYVINVLEYFEKYERFDRLLENVTEKWNLVDWPENLRDNYDFPLTRPIGEGCHNVINAFYCGMVSHIDEINSILDLPATGKKQELYNSFIKEFYDKEKHLFRDSKNSDHTSLHSNILPLLFDIGIDSITQDKIISKISEKRLSASGTYMSFFILSALKRVGKEDLILELILDEKSWSNMLKEGATTCYEAWGKDQKWNTSLFHPWSACPVILLLESK